jgi:hypothetical protein
MGRTWVGGYQAEDDFWYAVVNISGIKVVDISFVGKDPGCVLAIAKASHTQDQRGVDFWVFSKGRWVAVDLTTSEDPEVLGIKEAKATLRGVKLLKLPHYTLRLASDGRRWALYEVKRALENI